MNRKYLLYDIEGMEKGSDEGRNSFNLAMRLPLVVSFRCVTGDHVEKNTIDDAPLYSLIFG